MTWSSPSGVSTILRSDYGHVAVLSIDSPQRSMNVVDAVVLRDLAAQVDTVLEDEEVTAIVLTSAKPGSFGAGADVSWLPELADSAEAETFLDDVKDLMLRLVHSPKPLVAALNGPAFGGALELALAARAIIGVEDVVLGLPEVTLDLLPGGGGTQLLGRFVPPAVAAELLTSGRRIDATEASRLGIIEEVVDTADLIDTACRRASELAASGSAEVEILPGEAAEALTNRREELRASRRGLSETADRILDAMRIGIEDGLEAGLAAETRFFLDRLRSPEVRSSIHLFQVEASAKRRTRKAGAGIVKFGVVGGGQMGSGIAATAVSLGMECVIADLDESALDRARAYRDRVLQRTAPRDGRDHRVDAWTSTTRLEDFSGVDAVVEAVFESPEVKAEVLSRLSEVVSPHTLITSNTSGIPIQQLAGSVEDPTRFLGTHFFSPVDRMRLVEVIPHDGTSESNVDRAMVLARGLGKVPVVTGDAPGFFTSRIYARWLIEGVRLLLEGVDPGRIDNAAIRVGFPVGPMLALDEATLDLVVQASITQVADRVIDDRLDLIAVRGTLELLIDAGIRGRRYGSGFYTYDEDGRRSGPNRDVLGILGVDQSTVQTQGEISERLLLAFASECLLCWDDGTLCHPDDGDLASVLGIGFPRALGGPFHWIDEVGANRVMKRLEMLGTEAFPTGTTLPRLKEMNGTFAGERRREVPFRLAP